MPIPNDLDRCSFVVVNWKSEEEDLAVRRTAVLELRSWGGDYVEDVSAVDHVLDTVLTAGGDLDK